MGQLLLFIVVALVVASIVFGVTVMVSGGDSGLTPVEPDGRAVPLPSDRPLGEEDIIRTKFDTALRGYRMAQVDQALQRAAYDIGYKGELIGVLEAEVTALREGRIADADVFRRAREAAVAPPPPPPAEVAADSTDDAEPAAGAAAQPAADAAQPAAVQPADRATVQPAGAAAKPVEPIGDVSPDGPVPAAEVPDAPAKRPDGEPVERR
jgi:DivIVA domain-containing protein